MKLRLAAAAALFALSGAQLQARPAYLQGDWGGPHIGIAFEGALGSIAYDCASGTIDAVIYPGKDGAFTAKGVHRPGQGGPVRVGQIFRSVRATYAGQVNKDSMTLTVTLEDGTEMGPFTLTRGAQPQLTRCL